MQSFYLILINLLVVFVGLFIHGDPPKHYYLTIYIVPIILFSLILAKFNYKIILSMLGIIFLINIFNYNKLFILKSDIVSFDNQVEIVDGIIKDANGKKFKLKRVGVNDHFENNFANNYIYLLKIKGINIDPNADLKYTIYENDTKNPYFKKE